MRHSPFGAFSKKRAKLLLGLSKPYSTVSVGCVIIYDNLRKNPVKKTNKTGDISIRGVILWKMNEVIKK